jgi:uncharacterized protein YcsI (UPF0317 family)
MDLMDFTPTTGDPVRVGNPVRVVGIRQLGRDEHGTPFGDCQFPACA